MAWNTLGPWKVKRALTGSWHVQGPCTKLGGQRVVQGDLPILGVLHLFAASFGMSVCIQDSNLPDTIVALGHLLRNLFFFLVQY